MNKVPEFISKLDSASDAKKVMANAKAHGRDDVYWAAFQRVCILAGINYNDPLQKDFYGVLAAYEELLSEKNGRTTKAVRTRQKLARHSIEECLRDWALGPPTKGFETLLANGMSQLTAEFLVVKYASRFPQPVVNSAKKRFFERGVQIEV